MIRTGKWTNHRYRIDEPCISRTQLQNLFCKQTVWLFELLEEDRFSAPDGFQEEEGYEYFDCNREYQKSVTDDIICARIIRQVIKRVIIK